MVGTPQPHAQNAIPALLEQLGLAQRDFPAPKFMGKRGVMGTGAAPVSRGAALTSQQLLVGAHGADADLLVDDVNPAEAGGFFLG